MIHEMVMARYPAHQVTIINRGIGGNTVRDLFERWSDDVINFQPDWLSVKIGINDLHCWLSKDAQRSVSPEQYAELYDRILARARKETKAQLVLVDPFYVSSDKGTGTWRATVLEHLPKYIRVVDRLARKYKARHIQAHAQFQALLKYHSVDKFCPEPVHPYASGHMVIAHAWLAAVGW
jgi:lysophospholipase L1-like esterase